MPRIILCANISALAPRALNLNVLTTHPAAREAAGQSHAQQAGDNITHPGAVGNAVWLLSSIAHANLRCRATAINEPWLLKFGLYVIDRDGSFIKHKRGCVQPVENRPRLTSYCAAWLNTYGAGSLYP